MTVTRYRDESDVAACVEALRVVHETAGYPTNWPADPARWLRPPGILRAWVAATEDVPVAGHVILMQPLPGESSAEVTVSSWSRPPGGAAWRLCYSRP